MLSFTAVAEAFLGDCLGGRVESFGGDFEGSSITVPSGAEHVDGLGAATGESADATTETEEEEAA
jgi:hypothetical protein